MNPIYFDIETAGLPANQLESVRPEFQAPSNYKDPKKIEGYIAEEEAEWIRRAALSALTGEVLAIGVLQDKGYVCLGINGESEKEIIEAFWYIFDNNFNSFVGFNIRRFDLPFLTRRSFKLGIPVPYTLREGRYWSMRMIDLMDQWVMGDYKDSISLDTLAKFLGVGAKTGTGQAFAGLWLASKEAGSDYIRNDLEITRACYERMNNRKRGPLKEDGML